jgi:DNA-binding CsgD family transcriptional regulator
VAFDLKQGPVAIRGRMARAEDAAALLGFLECYLWRRDVGAADLADFVARHLQIGALRGGMIEEIHDSADQSVVLSAVGASAFVTDAAVETFLASKEPGAALAFLKRVAAGGEGILTSESEIAAASSGGGLNLMVLAFAHRYADSDDPNCRALLARAIGHFVEAHSGFLISQIVREDPEPIAGVLISSGMRDINRFHVGDLQLVLTHRHRDADLPLFPDSITAQILAHSPPIIRFSAAQRALLELACEGMTDEDIAAQLALSINTVKRTWKLIYDRVAVRAPQVLPGRSASVDGTAVRGTEKRRYLTAYLTQHPQELRPYL